MENYFEKMSFLEGGKKLFLYTPENINIELSSRGESGFIFDSTYGNMYTLSETAAFILSQLRDTKHSTSIEDIVRNITDVYFVDKEQAENDLIELLCNLKDLNIEVKGE